jgi:cytoskeletal protein RodZ
MTIPLHETPIAAIELNAPLKSARRIGWLILGVCVVFVVAGALWLFVLYFASLVELPGAYASFAKSISESQDISVLKQACLSLTKLDEADRISRLNWIVWAPTLGLALAVICASLSAWLLVTIKRIEKHLAK